MKHNDEELKYKDLIDTLKSLQQVKAPKNFETKLMRKINSQTTEKEKSFWGKLFIPSRLIPSAGLAVIAVILLFVFNVVGEELEDPLSMEPKIREDIFAAETMEDISERREQLQEEAKKDQLGKTESGTRSRNETLTGRDRNNIADNDQDYLADSNLIPTEPGQPIASGYTTNGYHIEKSGLNFRQVTLNEEERMQLNRLREQFKTLIQSQKNN
jgi:hypothetical protein